MHSWRAVSLRQLRQRQEKKWKEREVYKVTSRLGLYFTNMGSWPRWTDFHQICMVVGVHDVIIHSNFGFNAFSGFRSTGGQNFHFPIDFPGHRYNSADATAQPVISVNESSFWCLRFSFCLSTWCPQSSVEPMASCFSYSSVWQIADFHDAVY